MFADPQSVTYNSVAKSLPAIGRSPEQSVYKLVAADAEYELTLSHSFKTRNRVVARLKRTAVVSDVLVPAQNLTASATVTITADFPSNGFALADVQKHLMALRDWASDGNLLKLVGGET